MQLLRTPLISKLGLWRWEDDLALILGSLGGPNQPGIVKLTCLQSDWEPNPSQGSLGVEPASLCHQEDWLLY